MDRTRNDNSNLSQKLQQASHEKQELEQSLHKYEIELTVSQQKNKTCQQEVRCVRACVCVYSGERIERATLGLFTNSYLCQLICLLEFGVKLNHA